MVILKTGAKNLFLTIFSVAVLAFGFGALNVPEAEAKSSTDRGWTISSSNEIISICSSAGGTFTVTNTTGESVDSAKIFFTGGITDNCSIVSGTCNKNPFTSPLIVKDKVIATVKVGEDIKVFLEIPVVKSAAKEFFDEGVGANYCYNDCNDDITAADTEKDCADSDCSGKTCYIGTQRGTCNNASKACVLPTGTLTLSASPTSVVAGNTTTITFTSNFDGVKITLSGLSSKNCITDNNKRCSIDINPSSTGAISAIATKSGYTSPISPTIIQVVSANTITITASPATVVVGVPINITFETNVEGVVITLSGKANGTCTTGVNSPFTCPISVIASSAGIINVVAAKTGTTPPLTPGTATIGANSPGMTGGGTGGIGAVGANGLTTASLSVIIGRMIDWLLSVAAGLAVLSIIIGGVYYVTAAGNDAQIETAKKMIAYSIIGLVFVIVSYSIVVTINSVITG